MNRAGFLETVGSPYGFVKVDDEEEVKWMPHFLYRLEGRTTYVKKLRGFKMNTKVDLMNEFGAALQFFDGFGENWHALKDCLRSLEESDKSDSYLIIISDSQKVLLNESPEALHWLITTIVEVGEYWSEAISDGDIFDRPPRPFKVLFRVPSQDDLRLFSARVGDDMAKIKVIR